MKTKKREVDFIISGSWWRKADFRWEGSLREKSLHSPSLPYFSVPLFSSGSFCLSISHWSLDLESCSNTHLKNLRWSVFPITTIGDKLFGCLQERARLCSASWDVASLFVPGIHLTLSLVSSSFWIFSQAHLISVNWNPVYTISSI